jgi:hypothetical protein
MIVTLTTLEKLKEKINIAIMGTEPHCHSSTSTELVKFMANIIWGNFFRILI